MKKRFISKVIRTCLATGLVLSMGNTINGVNIVNAADGVEINEENIPDEAFRNYISKNADTDKDGVLSESEIEFFEKIEIWGSKWNHNIVKNIKGIEFFSNLKSLLLSGSEISALDLSNNTELTSVMLIDNFALESVDLSKNTKLERLDCDNSELVEDVGLKTIDLSNNVNLKRLDLSNNRFTKLDVSNNTLLTTIKCNRSAICTIDVSHNTLLEGLQLQSNPNITKIDVSNNPKLTSLFCTNMNIEEWDIDDAPLASLSVTNCGVDSLDVSIYPDLTVLWCEENNIQSLDLSKNSNLSNVYCSDNQLSELILGKNTKMLNLYCDNNNLKSIDISGCPNLGWLDVDNNQLESLNLSNNANIHNLHCYSNKISSLDVSGCSELYNLLCHDNHLSSLDLSNNNELKVLYCQNNNIKDLDLSNTKIEEYYYSFEEVPFEVYRYAICDKNVNVLLSCDSGNHTWDNGTVETEPTCTSEGTKVYKCTRCGETKKESIAALGHKVVIDPGVKATKTSTGLTEGSHCSECGLVLKKQEVIPKVTDDRNANYSNEWVDGKWYDINGNQTYKATLQWKNNATGWWVEDTDGWYPANDWQKIDGVWYFFKPDGYMASAEYYKGYWFNKDGSWDSQYKLSWKSNDTGWWVEDISGWWPSSSWLKIDGDWYYFNSSGYMVTNQYVEGWWIDASGVCR